MTRPIQVVAVVVTFLSLTTMARADHGQSHVDVQVVGETTWRPVTGTVTKVGEAINREVLEATPQLVENPN